MKKCDVRLTDEERKCCDAIIDQLAGSSQKARRARILRQVDAERRNWAERQVATAFHCGIRTVENTRRHCVLEGFEQALLGCQRNAPSVPKLLDGKQESQLIALRLGPPPAGHGTW